MNAAARDALWGRLRAAALVEGEAPPAAAARSPWYVRVMLGIAGWVGAAFLIGFVGVGFEFVLRNEPLAFLTGAAFCAGAAFLFRASPGNDFLDQFALAVSFAGQALMVYALADLFDRSLSSAALAIALQQAVLFALLPNFIHRAWTAWSGTYAALFALGDAGLQALAPAAVTLAFLWVWLAEFDHARRGALLRAGGYGLALACVQTAVLHGPLWATWVAELGARRALGGEAMLWLGNLASGLVFVWAVLALLKREGLAPGSGPGRVALAGAGIAALVSLKAPGVGPALAILVMGFANANRILAGLGIVALLGYLSHYYYALHATLLEKSALLAATGVALLVARLGLRRWWPEERRA